MSQSQKAVTIVDCATGQSVPAVLRPELGEVEIINVESAWSPARLQKLAELRQNGVPKESLPQHVHWNWAMKALHTSGGLAFRSLGVEAAGKVQGLMTVRLAGKYARLDPDRDKELVYIDFVEVAPWNAREFTDSPIYKGVGFRLVQAAARLGIAEGFAGRVGLHSLPQSKLFYANACEMTALGPDAVHNDLEYFELTAAKAVELLKK